MKKQIIKKCSYCKQKLKRSDYTYARSLQVKNKEVFSYCKNCLNGKTGSDRGCEAKFEFAIAESEGTLEPINEIKKQFVTEKRGLVKRMVKQLGFIPSFGLVNSTPTFSTENLTSFNKLLIKKNAYKGVDILNDYYYLLIFSHLLSKAKCVGTSYSGIKTFFEQEGSWIKLLIDSDVLKDKVLKTPRGYKCIAKDGCVCNSLAELSVDNWLHRHKIRHEKEVFYPKDRKLNPNHRLRTDWQVGDYFIEFFGLKGDEDYDKKIETKRKLCEKYNIKLIEVHCENLMNISEVLGFLILNK